MRSCKGQVKFKINSGTQSVFYGYNTSIHWNTTLPRMEQRVENGMFQCILYVPHFFLLLRLGIRLKNLLLLKNGCCGSGYN